MIRHGIRFRTPHLVLVAVILYSASGLSAGEWVPRAPLPSARAAHGAAAQNGRIYVLGGQHDGGNTVATDVSIYNPATNTWTVVPNKLGRHVNPGVTAAGGLLYVVGGVDWSWAMTTVESYNPVTNTASIRAPLNVPRHALGAATIDGIVYAVGGDGLPGVGSLKTVEAYDPSTNSWSYRKDMPTARHGLAVAALDGILYATGGTPSGCGTFTTVEAYDPVTDTWTTRAPMLTGRVLHGLVAANGRLYAIGGHPCGGTGLASVESYDPSTNKWRPEPSLSSQRVYGGAALVGNVIYIAGGSLTINGRGLGYLAYVDSLDVGPVAPDNTAPVANDRAYGTTDRVAVSGNVITDATAASDADGDTLTASLVSSAAHGSVTLNADGSFTYTPSGTFGGVDTFTYRVNDGTDDSNTATVSVTVTDVTAPVVTVGANQSLEAVGPAGAPATVSASATDAIDGALAVSCTFASGATFPLGTTTVACSATDAGGNTGSASFTVTVVDTIAPVISGMPANQSYEATGPNGAVATWTGPTAQDIVSGSLAVSCSAQSGSMFALGTTTVSCSVTDAAGNASGGSFSVTVADTTAPTIARVSPSASVLSRPNHQLIPIIVTIQSSDAVSNPACSITSVSSNEPDNGLGDGDTANDIQAISALGVQVRAERSGKGSGRIYTINVTCVDAAGNAAASQTTVSVPKSAGK